MARFFVTGPGGFAGRHLESELLAAGHETVGLRCDLRDARAVAEAVAEAAPEYVVHLAAVTHVAHGEPADFHAVNVAGTENLLKALAALPAPPRKTLLASSANLYGANAGGAPIPEGAPVHPANEYGVSKAAMERLAATYADRLPIVVARPFNFTGRGQSETFLVPKLVAAFARRRPSVTLGNLAVSRDFSDVRDVARWMRLLAENAPAGATVNLCSGEAWSLLRVFDTLASLTGHRPEIVRDPALARGAEIPVLLGDRTRLDALLGARAGERIPFETTLKWMLA